MSWQPNCVMPFVMLCGAGLNATGLASPAASSSAAHSSANSSDAMQAEGFDDPFFTGNADPSAAPVDTRWQDDQVIEKQASKFVGPTPALSQLQDLWQHEVLSVGLSTQVTFRAQERPTKSDGFSFEHLRPRIYGQLGQSLSYFFEVDLAAEPTVLDASIAIQLMPQLGLRLGQLRVPLAAEFMQPLEDSILIDRSETVQALAAQRLAGLQLEGQVGKDVLRYVLAVQNGEGYRDLDWGRHLRGSARIDLTPLRLGARTQALRLDLGTAISYVPGLKTRLSHPLLGYGAAAFAGSQLSASGHVRLQLGPTWIASEVLWSRLDGGAGAIRFDILGGFAELGAAIARQRVEVVLRLDANHHSLRSDVVPFVIGGVRVRVMDALRLQVSYAWGPYYGRSSDWSPHQVRAGLWMVF